jgi:hypothetical protein
MSGFLAQPKIATPAEARAAPGSTDPLVQNDALQATRAAAGAAGFGSTILTSGSGLTTAQPTQKKTLLGG